jgi:hypothetical protein
MAAIYDLPPLTRRQTASLFFIGFALVLVPLVWGINRYYYGYTKYGPAAASSWSQPWMITSALILFFAALLWIRLLQRSRFSVLVYQDGLRIGPAPRAPKPARRGRPPVSRVFFPAHASILPWEAIAGVVLDQVEGAKGHSPLRTLTLYQKRGKPIRIAEARSAWDGLAFFGPPRVQNLSELTTRIKARLYPSLLPRLRNAFLNGQCLRFGPIGVEKSYLHLPARSPIRWIAVRRMTICSGKLVVELGNAGKTGSVARIPVFRIPNLELLLTLIDDLVLPDRYPG